MPEFYRDHILVNEHTAALPYTSLVQGRNKVIPRTNAERIEQGMHVRSEFNAAVEAFSEDAPSDEFVYVVFQSVSGFFLDIDKFGARNYRLASYKQWKRFKTGQ